MVADGGGKRAKWEAEETAKERVGWEVQVCGGGWMKAEERKRRETAESAKCEREEEEEGKKEAG